MQQFRVIISNQATYRNVQKNVEPHGNKNVAQELHYSTQETKCRTLVTTALIKLWQQPTMPSKYLTLKSQLNATTHIQMPSVF